MSEVRRFCSFHLCGHLLGIEVEHVREVLRHHGVTRIPLAPQGVVGLLNLRGQIVTVVDLAICLGLEREPWRQAFGVLLREPWEGVCLLVERVGEVVEVGDDIFESAPETLPAAMQPRIKGVYKLPDALLEVLDPGEVIPRVEAAGP